MLDSVVRVYDDLIRFYPKEDSYSSFFMEERQCIYEISKQTDYTGIRQGLISYNESKFRLPSKGHKKEEFDDEIKKRRTDAQGRYLKA